jgi:hypothetical protein
MYYKGGNKIRSGWGNSAFWGKRLQIIKCKLLRVYRFQKKKDGSDELDPYL